MAKKKKGVSEAPVQQNFVAKHARTFNKASVHRDRTKYKRKDKHRNKNDYGAFFMTRIVDKIISLC